MSSQVKQKRQLYSAEEKQAVRQGIIVLGVGKWKELKKYRHPYLDRCTNRQIKDCFRGMRDRGELDDLDPDILVNKSRKRRGVADVDDGVFDTDESSAESDVEQVISTTRTATRVLPTSREKKRRVTIPVDSSSEEEEEEEIGKPLSARQSSSKQGFVSFTNNDDDFIESIDELFVQCNPYTMKVKEMMQLLEDQNESKFDSATRRFVIQRLRDLNMGRVQPRVALDEGVEKDSTANTAASVLTGDTDVTEELSNGEMDTTNEHVTVFEVEEEIGSHKDECTVEVDGETLNKDIQVFHSVSKVFSECESHIELVANDPSRNDQEIEDETHFWRQTVEHWKVILPFSRRQAVRLSNDAAADYESLLKDAETFVQVMQCIKACLTKIQDLADNKLRPREDIAKDTWFWREREQEWKAKLPNPK